MVLRGLVAAQDFRFICKLWWHRKYTPVSTPQGNRGGGQGGGLYQMGGGSGWRAAGEDVNAHSQTEWRCDGGVGSYIADNFIGLCFELRHTLSVLVQQDIFQAVVEAEVILQ